MTAFGDVLEKAIDNKNNDLNSYVWKGPRKEIMGQRMQEVIKLMDASEEQLRQFYNHCQSMLYNTDKDNPGRYVLLDIIKDQRLRCNAELYLRFLAKEDPKTNRPGWARFNYLQAINDTLTSPENLKILPRNKWKETPIKVLTKNIPEIFQELPIELVRDACLDNLGKLSKKHITFNFLIKLGVWFTPEEMKDLAQDEVGNPIRDINGKIKDRFSVAKERLGIKPSVKLNTNDKKGLLTYTELRSMLKLVSNKYSNLTTDQLTTLRDKVLYKLQDEAMFHASQWETLKTQIEKVCEARNISL